MSIAGRAFAAACVVLTTAFAAGAQEDAGRIVERILRVRPADEVPAEEVERWIGMLVAGRAVEAIDRGLGRGERSADILWPLTDALRRIDGVEAVAVLRKLTFGSRIEPTEIDWLRLRKALASGVAGGAAAVLSQAPGALQDALLQAAAADVEPARQMAELARWLNSLLNQESLHLSLAPVERAPPSLDFEAQRLLESARGGSIGINLRLERLNRRLLEAALDGILRPLDGLPLTSLTEEKIGLAVNALGRMNSPEARELMLSARPVGTTAIREHIRLLGQAPEFAAAEMLAQYLLDQEHTVQARKLLVERFSRDASTGISVMGEALARVLWAGGEIATPVLDSLMDVLESMSESERVGELFAACMLASDPAVRMAAIDRVTRLPSLAAGRPVLDAVSRIAGEDRSAEMGLALLAVLRAGKSRDALFLVSGFLEHADMTVRASAVDTMRAVSGRNLGLDPQKWMNAIIEEPEKLLEPPPVQTRQLAIDKPAPAPEPVQEPEPNSPVVPLAVIGGVVGLAWAFTSFLNSRGRKKVVARKAQRKRLVLSVRYRIMGAGDELAANVVKAKTLDVSRMGLKLNVSIPNRSVLLALKKKSAFLSIEIDLPKQGAPVKAYGNAVWMKPVEGSKTEHEVGLEFKEITNLDRDRLNKLVSG